MNMAANVQIKAQTVTGQTMEQLSTQIQRRTQVLKETTEQAVTAIAITTMKSLRAATPKSKGKIAPISDTITNNDLGISVYSAPEYVVSFKTVGGKHVPCIRMGSKRGAVVNLKAWYKIDLADMYIGKVFRVVLSEGRLEAWKRSKSPYFIVARDINNARLAVEQRYNKLVKRYGSLAKDAWSRAMMLASNRPAKFVSGEKAKSVLAREVVVTKTGQGVGTGSFTISVQDNLRYAGKIIGGDAAVNSALMKACNSTNGYVNKWISKHPASDFFGTQLPANPFPPECFGE